MNGAAASYLEQSDSLRLVERPDQFDSFLDAVNHRSRIFAVGAVPDMYAFLAQSHDDLVEGPFLLGRIQMDSHRGAAAQGHQEQLVGTRPCVAATGRGRLIGVQDVASIQHDLLERTGAGRSHDHRAGGNGRLKHAWIVPSCRVRHLMGGMTTALWPSSFTAMKVGRRSRLPLAFVIGLTASAHAADRPDPQLTPGLADPALTKDVICAPGFTTYTVRYVPSARTKAIYKLYGMLPDMGDCPCVLDHLIPLQLGGSNKPHNLWPQSRITKPWNSVLKDKLEKRLRTEVCAGKTDLSSARQEIAADWIKAYISRFGQPPPLPPSVFEAAP